MSKKEMKLKLIKDIKKNTDKPKKKESEQKVKIYYKESDIRGGLLKLKKEINDPINLLFENAKNYLIKAITPDNLLLWKGLFIYIDKDDFKSEKTFFKCLKNNWNILDNTIKIIFYIYYYLDYIKLNSIINIIIYIYLLGDLNSFIDIYTDENNIQTFELIYKSTEEEKVTQYLLFLDTLHKLKNVLQNNILFYKNTNEIIQIIFSNYNAFSNILYKDVETESDNIFIVYFLDLLKKLNTITPLFYKDLKKKHSINLYQLYPLIKYIQEHPSYSKDTKTNLENIIQKKVIDDSETQNIISFFVELTNIIKNTIKSKDIIKKEKQELDTVYKILSIISQIYNVPISLELVDKLNSTQNINEVFNILIEINEYIYNQITEDLEENLKPIQEKEEIEEENEEDAKAEDNDKRFKKYKRKFFKYIESKNKEEKKDIAKILFKLYIYSKLNNVDNIKIILLKYLPVYEDKKDLKEFDRVLIKKNKYNKKSDIDYINNTFIFTNENKDGIEEYIDNYINTYLIIKINTDVSYIKTITYYNNYIETYFRDSSFSKKALNKLTFDELSSLFFGNKSIKKKQGNNIIDVPIDKDIIINYIYNNEIYTKDILIPKTKLSIDMTIESILKNIVENNILKNIETKLIKNIIDEATKIAIENEIDIMKFDKLSTNYNIRYTTEDKLSILLKDINSILNNNKITKHLLYTIVKRVIETKIHPSISVSILNRKLTVKIDDKIIQDLLLNEELRNILTYLLNKIINKKIDYISLINIDLTVLGINKITFEIDDINIENTKTILDELSILNNNINIKLYYIPDNYIDILTNNFNTILENNIKNEIKLNDKQDIKKFIDKLPMEIDELDKYSSDLLYIISLDKKIEQKFQREIKEKNKEESIEKIKNDIILLKQITLKTISDLVINKTEKLNDKYKREIYIKLINNNIIPYMDIVKQICSILNKNILISCEQCNVYLINFIIDMIPFLIYNKYLIEFDIEFLHLISTINNKEYIDEINNINRISVDEKEKRIKLLRLKNKIINKIEKTYNIKNNIYDKNYLLDLDISNESIITCINHLSTELSEYNKIYDNYKYRKDKNIKDINYKDDPLNNCLPFYKNLIETITLKYNIISNKILFENIANILIFINYDKNESYKHSIINDYYSEDILVNMLNQDRYQYLYINLQKYKEHILKNETKLIHTIPLIENRITSIIEKDKQNIINILLNSYRRLLDNTSKPLQYINDSVGDFDDLFEDLNFPIIKCENTNTNINNKSPYIYYIEKDSKNDKVYCLHVDELTILLKNKTYINPYTGTEFEQSFINNMLHIYNKVINEVEIREIKEDKKEIKKIKDSNFWKFIFDDLESLEGEVISLQFNKNTLTCNKCKTTANTFKTYDDKYKVETWCTKCMYNNKSYDIYIETLTLETNTNTNTETNTNTQ